MHGLGDCGHETLVPDHGPPQGLPQDGRLTEPDHPVHASVPYGGGDAEALDGRHALVQ